MFYVPLAGHHNLMHDASHVHSLYLSPCHAYLGVPKGVTVLEFAPPEPEEQQGELLHGAEEEEDLPECPDHRPSTYIEGKPQSIIRLLLFCYHVQLSINYDYVLLHYVLGVDMTPLLHI